jgi:hypothetical protein
VLSTISPTRPIGTDRRLKKRDLPFYWKFTFLSQDLCFWKNTISYFNFLKGTFPEIFSHLLKLWYFLHTLDLFGEIWFFKFGYLIFIANLTFIKNIILFTLYWTFDFLVGYVIEKNLNLRKVSQFSWRNLTFWKIYFYLRLFCWPIYGKFD